MPAASFSTNGGRWVSVAKNGIEAVDAVQANDFDIVLMDIHMPEMDGIEATRAIRNLEGRRARVPIIAVTANAMRGDREKYIDADMDEYVSKPIDPDRLAAAIAKVCNVGTELNLATPLPIVCDIDDPSKSVQIQELLDDLDALIDSAA